MCPVLNENDPDPKFRRDFPGGRLEFGEAPEQSLLREIQEEVGLKVRIIAPVHTWYYVKDDFQLVGIDYYCRWLSGDVVLSDEHESYEWLTEQELQEKTWGAEEKKEYLVVFRYHNIIQGESDVDE